MNRGWVLPLSALVAFAGCSRPDGAGGGPEGSRATSVTPEGAGSSFHLAVIDASGGHCRPSRLRGRTVLIGCGRVLLSTDEGVSPDPTLEAAAGGIAPVDLSGHWPNEAWLQADGAKPKTRDAYRWGVDHWARIATWKWDSPPSAVAPWGGGCLVNGAVREVQAASGTWDQVQPLSYYASDGEREPPEGQLLPKRLPSAPASTNPAPQAMAMGVPELASVDGALFVLVATTDRLRVERWRPESPKTDLYELAPHAATARVWVYGARDVVAYGGASDIDGAPLLSHFDGERWTPEAAPPGIDLVVGYDRNDAGVERAFAFRGAELSAWERAPRGIWRALPLPALGVGNRIDGQWITDNDAWLHVAGDGDGGGELLRLRPVRHVYAVGKEPAVVAIGTTGYAAASPLPAEPPDPSLFHDAVVGYPDRPGEAGRNRLRLCPVRGRTFVCGVSDAPLVATDDAVVYDAAAEAKLAAGEAYAPPADDVKMAGSWPDHAWMVAQAAGTTLVQALHYEHDQWNAIASWAPPREDAAAAWGDGLLISPLTRIGEMMPGGTRVRIAWMRGGSSSSFATHLIPGGELSLETDTPEVSSFGEAGETLFLTTRHGVKLAVERVGRSGSAGDQVYDLATLKGVAAHGRATVDAKLWVAGADDAVVFGSVNGEPLLERFDGHAWTNAPAPPGIERVVAYDRTGAGVERVFGRGPQKELALYERTRGAEGDGGAWRRIALPTLTHGDTIDAVWLANGDAWLKVSPGDDGQRTPQGTLTRAPRLMRLSPVKRVWRFPRQMPR